MATAGTIPIRFSGKRGVKSSGKVAVFNSAGHCTVCCTCSKHCYFLWVYDWANSGCVDSMHLEPVGLATSITALGTKVVDGVTINFATGWSLNTWKGIQTNSDTGFNFSINSQGYSTTAKYGYLVQSAAEPDCASCDGSELIAPAPPNPYFDTTDPHGDSFSAPFYTMPGCYDRNVDVGFFGTTAPNDYYRYVVWGVQVSNVPRWVAVEEVDHDGNRVGNFTGTTSPGTVSPDHCIDELGFVYGNLRKFHHGAAENDVLLGIYSNWSFIGRITNKCWTFDDLKAFYGIA